MKPRRSLVNVLSKISAASNKVNLALWHVTEVGRPKQEDPYHYLSEAFSLHDQYRYDEALQLYDKTLELAPTDFTALHNRALLHHEVGRHDEALADFSQVIFLRERLSPDHPDTLNYKGSVYNILERYDEAVPQFNRTLILRDDNVEALYKRAIALRHLGFLEDALKDLDRAIKLSPNAVELPFERAINHFLLGHDDQTFSDFIRGSELVPPDTDVDIHYNGLASEFLEPRTAQAGLQLFNKLVDAEPQNEHFRLVQALGLFAVGRYEEALAEYTELIARHPSSYPTRYQRRGMTYHHLTRYEDAIEDFNKALELRPNNYLTLAVRGSSYYSLGRLDEAGHDYDAALLIRPNNGLALAYRALQRARLNRIETGSQDIEKALAIAPESTDIRYCHAAFLSLTGNREDAIDILSKVVGENPVYKRLLPSDPDLASLHDLPAWGALFDVETDLSASSS